MTIPTPRIRAIGPDDIGVMRQLNAMFADAFEDPETYASTPPDDGYLARAFALETTIVLVAEHGDEVVAGLVAYELVKMEQARSELYIYDLAVAEPWRRRGVATALIGYLRRIASERGAWVVYVQADYADPPAIALYESLGRREEVLHFDIDPG